jgi:glycosyltransferase involved in cell wall biosynthesis
VAGVSLSIVIPVFNDASHLPATIEGVVAALDGTHFDAELIVVDDGSTDGSADAAWASADRVPLRVLTQPNRGRFEARRAGLAAASHEFVLFLDARVRLAGDALRFVEERVRRGDRVWNGHVEVAAENTFGLFWRLLAELAWRDYFDDPRTTSFGVADFDRFPKGSGCLLAPRALLEAAFATFETRYADVRMANDDARILRALAAQQPIAISPRFACVYSPRTNAWRFIRHALHRGVVFVDGHGTPESRFFPFVVAFFPLSALAAVASLRRPFIAPAVLAACGVGAAALGIRAGRSRREVEALAIATPLYALGHGLGMWRGLAEIVRARLRR